MKKIFIVLILCLTLCFNLAGCLMQRQTNANIIENNPLFFTVETGNNEAIIYVHKETKVMYLFVKRDTGGGLIVMLDENGMPLLWQGE